MAEGAKANKSKATVAPSTAPAVSEKRPLARQDEEYENPNQEEEVGFKEFLWNSETKEFLGRTGRSWLDITIFYAIFFASLYCFFMLSWYVSLLVIDPKIPYQNKENAILYNKGPGLTFRPVPDRNTNGGSTLIYYRPGISSGYKFWTKQLKLWMRNIPVASVNGTPPMGTFNCSRGRPMQPNKQVVDNTKSCLVDKTVYGMCDGSNPAFGYDIGEPCILLKLNRIYGWTPEPLKNLNKLDATTDAALKAYLNTVQSTWKDRVFVWCEGEHDHDKEALGPLTYFPGPYIESKYFPYLSQSNYQSPFLMLKLNRPLAGAIISIKCRAIAGNLPNKDTGTGFLKFQIGIKG